MNTSNFPFPGIQSPSVFDHRVQAFKEGYIYALNLALTNAINGVDIQDLLPNLQRIAELQQSCFALTGVIEDDYMPGFER